MRRHYLNDGEVVLVGKHELIYVDERAGRHRATLTDNQLPAIAAKPAEAAAPADAEEEAEDDQDLEATGPN